MAEPFLGEIRMFAGNFAPRGWALCDGQLLPIAQNQALFAIIGTFYGGDGQRTFALPDLRGRSPLHQGQGPGLTNRPLGGAGGAESVTLGVGEMPAHTHALSVSSTRATDRDPAGRLFAVAEDDVYGPVAATTGALLSPTGGGLPHENRQPYVAVDFIIALEGIFPARG